ncbi:MAG: TPM domain-containing protein [Candidatus Galacturonibacter soehngenii]|nr:TPM domain-containing protein [Candidatus Galacturonibacter soehngenii]
MMKRYVIGWMSLLILLLVCGFSSPTTKVYDNANILSEAEEERLNELCREAANETKADFVIVTVERLDGKAITAYADDFYDYQGFGFEKKEGTGTIFLLAMEEREITFSTSGACVELFSGSASDRIINEVSSYLSDGDYYTGFETYIKMTKEYIENGGKWSDSFLLDWVVSIVASLVVASIVVWIMCSGSKSKMTVNGYTYAIGNKSNVLKQHDVFQRTTTIRRHIDTTPKGGSGGGGTRIGSSGNRHGGSSGKF